jgi:hypothetical protein
MAIMLTGAGGLVAAGSASARLPSSSSLVVLTKDHVARTRPSGKARRIRVVRARLPLTRDRTVLPVLGRATGRRGEKWIRVRLPGRPNGHTGWIRALRTHPRSTGWQISIRLKTRRVTVSHGGRVQRRFKAIVGAPSTPTPRGRFYIEEAVSLAPGDAGGPFALATSARSDVLQEFNGGPGQIALHGIKNLPPDPLGAAASHGCVRLSTRAITWLARRIGRGVPLTISS